ncbi:MAG: hypothetical protein H0V40_03205, partial [Actinobacteria bacterium]|nr:hypothetical protein [Actinomycetota bacterium]
MPRSACTPPKRRLTPSTSSWSDPRSRPLPFRSWRYARDTPSPWKCTRGTRTYHAPSPGRRCPSRRRSSCHTGADALNEEHGYVDVSRCDSPPEIGDRVTIVPNHACTTANMHDEIV